MKTLGTTLFGELLRRSRQTAALSQQGLAERAGLSVDALRALERGRRVAPRPYTLALLAGALNLTPEEHAAFIAVATGGPRPSPLPRSWRRRRR